jgi:hypothetical protein
MELKPTVNRRVHDSGQILSGSLKLTNAGASCKNTS